MNVKMRIQLNAENLMLLVFQVDVLNTSKRLMFLGTRLSRQSVRNGMMSGWQELTIEGIKELTMRQWKEI